MPAQEHQKGHKEAIIYMKECRAGFLNAFHASSMETFTAKLKPPEKSPEHNFPPFYSEIHFLAFKEECELLLLHYYLIYQTTTLRDSGLFPRSISCLLYTQ